MFGFACTETPTLMPAPIYYAHQLMQRQALVRKNGTLPFLRPDAKSQVTLRYRDGVPVAADTIVISSQHSPDMSLGTQMKPEFIEAIVEEIIRPVMPAEWLKDTKFLINPTGRFVVGGPQGDCGLTGARSLSIRTAAIARTAAAPSPARIRPRSTARQLMPAAMWPRTSLPPVWLLTASCRFRTRSALQNR